jgi:hypothetical protein
MKSFMSTSNNAMTPTPENFSPVLGGPLFQFFLRAHLSDDALQLVRRRTVVIALFAWLPLLLLSTFERHLYGGDLTVPFLLDVETHARFLVVVPLLIRAELMVHRRIPSAVRQFLERRLIPDDAMARFDAAIASSFRLRNSVLTEVLLIVFVYGVGILVVWRHYMALDAATWYATPTTAGARLSIAGIWYGYVSLPIFQFMMCRWYFRIAIWARLLWQVSRIRLNLIPTHPDRNAGLGFLTGTVYAFILFAAAHGALIAGQIANRIFFLGATLPEFKMQVAVLVIAVLCIVFAPLLVFAPQLELAKRTGNREYGILAERYVREFDARWLRGDAPANEPLLGSADLQSLADLGNSLEVVRTMRLTPITADSVLRLTVAVLVPIAPLALTLMPLDELVKTLFDLVF